MKTVKLTRGKVAFVDDKDFPRVSPYKWHAAHHGNTWYAKATVSGKLMLMHVFILGKTNSDHKDGDGLNNRRRNLRPASHQQQMRNRGLFKGRNFKGTECQKGHLWYARIIIEGKAKRLGSFSTEKEAAKAYDVLARKYFGEFARLNFK